MLHFALFLMLSFTHQYQHGFDKCLEIDFETPECSNSYKAVKKNPKSKHYKKYFN